MNEFYENISFLPERIKNVFEKCDTKITDIIDEIRIRACSPILLKCKGKLLYIDKNGNLSYNPTNMCVSFEEVHESFIRLCEFSVYSYIDEIKNGYITLKNGCRIGFCGTAVTNGNEIVSIKDITSLNIRIARNIAGCSEKIIYQIKKNGFGNILIAGSPMSGKTTLLRDLSVNISDMGKIVSVIDERREITSCVDKKYFDVLLSYPKSDGIQTALRTLSPDYIVTDEISTENELDAIITGLNTGINFALSIHASCFSELKRKEIYNILVSFSEFKYVVLLSDKNPGEIVEIKSSKEIL